MYNIINFGHNIQHLNEVFSPTLATTSNSITIKVLYAPTLATICYILHQQIKATSFLQFAVMTFIKNIINIGGNLVFVKIPQEYFEYFEY